MEVQRLNTLVERLESLEKNTVPSSASGASGQKSSSGTEAQRLESLVARLEAVDSRWRLETLAAKLENLAQRVGAPPVSAAASSSPGTDAQKLEAILRKLEVLDSKWNGTPLPSQPVEQP